MDEWGDGWMNGWVYGWMDGIGWDGMDLWMHEGVEWTYRSAVGIGQMLKRVLKDEMVRRTGG